MEDCGASGLHLNIFIYRRYFCVNSYFVICLNGDSFFFNFNLSVTVSFMETPNLFPNHQTLIKWTIKLQYIIIIIHNFKYEVTWFRTGDCFINFVLIFLQSAVCKYFVSWISDLQIIFTFLGTCSKYKIISLKTHDF